MTFSTQGSDSLFEYLNTGDDSNIEVGGTNMTGQTFTTPDIVPHTITQVRVKIYSEGTPGTLYAKIYHTSAGVATGLAIGQGDINGSTVGTDVAGIWYAIPMDEEILPDADTMYALVLSTPSGDTTNSIHWMVDTGNGYADGTEITSTNSGITWSTVAANDMMFEIWGTPGMSIGDAQAFRSLYETGDQLFVAAYKVIPDDDRKTEDCTRYFNIQLLEGTTIRGQVKMPAWGYKPVAIYLSADAAISWGAVNGTKIRIAGTAGSDFSTYLADYELTASDWRGSDLTFLDTWVIIQAGDIEDYYSTTLVTYIGDTALLNDLGGTIFATGMPGIGSLRPDIFQTADVSVDHPPKVHTDTYVTEISGFFGAKMQSTWEDLSDLLGVDASFVGTGFWLIIGGSVIGVVGAAIGYGSVAIIISIPFFLVGAFGGLDLRYLLLITALVFLLVVAKFTIWKGG